MANRFDRPRRWVYIVDGNQAVRADEIDGDTIERLIWAGKLPAVMLRTAYIVESGALVRARRRR